MSHFREVTKFSLPIMLVTRVVTEEEASEGIKNPSLHEFLSAFQYGHDLHPDLHVDSAASLHFTAERTMVGVGEALAIWQNISRVVSTLEDLGTNSSVLSNEFGAEVNILRQRLHFYEEQIRSQRGPVNSSVVAILTKAELILNEAEPRVKSIQDMQRNIDGCGCRSWICWVYAKLSLALFPEKLKETLKKVTEEIDKISSVMKLEEDFTEKMDKQRLISRTIYTTFHDSSNLYVPIQGTHNNTIRAIEEVDGPSIVLLYGGVGKGKSTLARYVCAHYGGGKQSGLFEHVILVLCGGNRTRVDHLSKQFEILQVLSPTSLGASPTKEETGAHERIEKALRTFLRDNKVLIILDDVSDPEFLYQMWKVGQEYKHVKYFVTSQRGDLCDGCLEDESSCINMGDPNQKEARQILASLVGLRDKIIPQGLKKEADKMIEVTGGNPLALACLTSHFAKGHHKTDKRTWQQAVQQLDDLLARPERRNVLGLNHESASLWAAMELCLKSLETSEAKDILLLMYACKGEAIPEEALRIWYKVTKTSALFSSSIEELSARELLKSTRGTIIVKMMKWSLRPLLKLYMDGHMADEEKRMERLLGLLLGDSHIRLQSCKQKRKSKWFRFSLGGNGIAHESIWVNKRPNSQIQTVESDETRVASALLAMYFDPAHSNEVVRDVASWATNEFMNSNVSISDLQRKAIEPIIWLLDQPEEDDTWTEEHVQCVRQVFLKYVCECQLDYDNIYMLLERTGYTSATLAIVTAFADILAIDRLTSLNEEHLRVLKPLLDMLGSNQGIEQDLREAASKALLYIIMRATKEYLNITIINTFPILLAVLIRVIENSFAIPTHGSNSLAQNAAGTLWNMSYFGGDQINLKISNQRGALAALVRALSQDEDPDLQERAAGVLLCLCGGDEPRIEEQIVDEEGALAGLVRSLSEDKIPGLQKNSAQALANLSAGMPRVKKSIVRERGALAGLLRALRRQVNPDMQIHAARAFCNLVDGASEEIIFDIASECGLLKGLVSALFEDQNRLLQKYVAQALANLSFEKRPIKKKIVCEDGGIGLVLGGLVHALSREEDPYVQEHAARALFNLAVGASEAITLRIVREPEVLAGIAAALNQDKNPDLQEIAASTLENLSIGKKPIKMHIVSENDVLVGLVRALYLSNDDNTTLHPYTAVYDYRALHEYAAGALANLAGGGESTKAVILRENRALAALVTSLSEQGSPSLQRQAARALYNLARGGDWCKSKVVIEGGALAALMSALSEEGNYVCRTMLLGASSKNRRF